MQMGIPTGNLPVARSLTLPGYAAAVAGGARKRGLYLKAANTAFQTSLDTQTFNPARIPYSVQLATQMYRLNGLGDLTAQDLQNAQDVLDTYAADSPGDTQTSPPATSDSSWWTDVLKNIAGPLASGVGMGVGGKIAGVNPWAKPVAPALPGMSATTKMVLAGGGILVGAFVLSKLLKKSPA